MVGVTKHQCRSEGSNERTSECQTNAFGSRSPCSADRARHHFSGAALACGVSARTAAKWWHRFEQNGLDGVKDRTSRPRSLRNPTPAMLPVGSSHCAGTRLTGAHIAAKTGVSPATVSRVLRRAGLSRLRDLEPTEP
ncbi:helix-turn-helix domain-containing protein, partial [Roseovarius sp. S4756]|uniref:helix-turn-helix domain-containing protein n=1 Tax=Roseovarius maritimus TaxID=3342637 RepID=UPI003B66E6E6